MAANTHMTLLDLQRTQFGRIAHMTARTMETLVAFGDEMMAFAGARITDDIETAYDLLGCETLTEARRLQVEFWQRALEQYVAEAAKVVELARRDGNATGAHHARNQSGSQSHALHRRWTYGVREDKEPE